MSVRNRTICGLPVAVVGVAAASGLLTVPVVALCGLPAAFLAVAPLAVAVAVVLLWNTQWGICFAAFAITTLGSVRYEVLDVTLYLPEVFILALVAKEAIGFLFRRERFAECMPARAVALYLCAVLAAVGTGLAYQNGLKNVLQDFRRFTEFIVLLWLVCQRVTTREQATRIAFCYVLGGTLIAVHATFQHLADIGFLDANFASGFLAHVGTRTGSFYHPNIFGASMLMAVGAAAGLAMASKRRSVKLVMVVCIGMCLAAEVFTKSRGAWLCMAVTFAFIGVSVRPSGKTIAAAAVGAIALAVVLGPSIAQRMSTFRDPQDDTSLLGRARFYTAAAHIVRAHPFLGVGWGGYYDIDKIVAADRYVKTPRQPGSTDATVHGLFLQLIVTEGLFGLLSFLVIIVVWVERIWRARKTKPREDGGHALFVGITAGLVGFLCQNAWEDHLYQQVTAPSFWLLLGLSFVTGHWVATRRPSYRMPVALVGTAAALFLLFVYGALCLESYDFGPASLENNVAHAIAEGNVEKALGIARNATKVTPPLPMAYTVYAQVLLKCGEEDEALEQLAKAVGVRRQLVEGSYRETREAYYFAPARLTLGKCCLEKGKLLDAVENFELARADATLTDAEYGDFRAALYQAYAKQGLWARALEFGEPSDQELDGFDSRDLAIIARVCEGRQNWELVRRLGERLLTREATAAEAHYVLGRADLAQGQYERSAVHLEQAVSSGHVHAAFFLGTALEKIGQPARAIQSFLSTPSGDLYRPFALAKTLALLEDRSREGQTRATVTRQALLDELDQEIAGMRTTERPFVYNKDRRFTPIALKTSEACFAAGGRFPMLILWEDGKAPAATPARISFSCPDTLDSFLLMRGANTILQLKWVENLVNWEGVERLPAGTRVVPGWIDTARDWFGLRPDRVAQIQVDEVGKSFLSIPKLTWFFSVPIRVEKSSGYLLAGRLKGRPGKGALAWQSLDEEEHVLSEGKRMDPESSNVWTWQAGYIHSEPQWDTMRVQLEVMPHTGTTSFGEVMLVKLDEPDQSQSDLKVSALGSDTVAR